MRTLQVSILFPARLFLRNLEFPLYLGPSCILGRPARFLSKLQRRIHTRPTILSSASFWVYIRSPFVFSPSFILEFSLASLFFSSPFWSLFGLSGYVLLRFPSRRLLFPASPFLNVPESYIFDSLFRWP